MHCFTEADRVVEKLESSGPQSSKPRRAAKWGDVLTSAEREELVKLRRELKQVKIEREILAKATAWFAREADTSPKRSSDS